MDNKANAPAKKEKHSLSAFTILVIVLAVLCIISFFLNGSPIRNEIIQTLDPEKYADLLEMVDKGETVTVIGAKLKDFVMAIPNGFVDASNLLMFIVALGGFLNVVMKTGALEAGINHLVHKMRGKEEWLIVALMFLFSLGGTTYGMAEETIGFYVFITSAMVMAGFDTMVALAVVLIGSASGVLGSTVNPFATGVAISALDSVGITANSGLIYLIGAVLWLSVVGVAIAYTLHYAKKVKKDKGSTILSLREQEVMREEFGTDDNSTMLEFTGRHKGVLVVFALMFIVMIVSLISYQDLIFNGDEEAFLAAFGWSEFLTGQPLGWWYFLELAAWFILGSIVIAIIGGYNEHSYIEAFIDGSKDLLSVGLIIAVSRGITVVMSATHMDFWILDQCTQLLSGVPSVVFVPVSFVVYLILSFLVPSTSGLAGLSMPVMGGLAAQLGFNPSVMVNIFCAGSGVVNMATPTSGVVMGGVAASRVEYSTFLKWVFKLLIAVAILCTVILTVAQMIV
ncbi:MAG: YfcC family protein [Peptoniphilaceae bacterium]|nr:YfcC family protein [Peptoniphilaceae bacterium]MDY6085526.1 YfcC family protein [Peptoniphilaceae bacterium]